MTTHEEKMKMIVDDKYPLVVKYGPEWMYENKVEGFENEKNHI